MFGLQKFCGASLSCFVCCGGNEKVPEDLGESVRVLKDSGVLLVPTFLPVCCLARSHCHHSTMKILCSQCLDLNHCLSQKVVQLDMPTFKSFPGLP